MNRSRTCTNPTTSSFDPRTTGNRECGASPAIRAAAEIGSEASRNTTSVRGTSTSRSCRSPAANTSSISLRSSGVSDSWEATKPRSSCSLMLSREVFGSPPSNRTTTSVHLDSSQMTGCVIRAIRFSDGATSSAVPSARCSASRLGANSPTTRVTKEIKIVTPRKPSAEATPEDMPASRNPLVASLDSVTAPNAEDSNAVTVTPICTEARKRLGLATSRATAAPRRPAVANARTWPSRSDTNASSAATNNPSKMIRASTMPTLISVVTAYRLPGTGGGTPDYSARPSASLRLCRPSGSAS